MVNYTSEYNRWLKNASEDPDLIEELKNMSDVEIEDAFYTNIAFGTGGLRGIIGAGTNRINIYTVAKASQGLSNYILKKFGKGSSVCIGFDSRIKSDLFAKVAATIFASNGIIVHIWPKLLPVSTLSFAVRHLHASAGIMITASHNPSKYNGYKVYGSDGCQVTTKAAADIFDEIQKLDVFSDIKLKNISDFQKFLENREISYISDEVLTEFLKEVKSQSMLFTEDINRNAAIVYSPLNGTGYLPVTRILKESGYTNLIVPEEQKFPDGNFPTCPYPNPEIREAMELSIAYAKKAKADLVLATDPDCDRVGVALKAPNGEYSLLSGNEIGLLLFDYICTQRTKHAKMPKDPVVIKTIVTTDLVEKIAENYKIKVINVLTGFKYIGEQIGILEKNQKESSYIFGFEESYGYLSGSYVRDKDAVSASYLICEMFSYYASKGISLLDKLNEIFTRYGFCLNSLKNYQFEGSQGFAKMCNIMETFRSKFAVNAETSSIAGSKICEILDYSLGISNLPKSDVLKFKLEDSCSIVIRPSGTEPKLKLYIAVFAKTKSEAQKKTMEIISFLDSFIR